MAFDVGPISEEEWVEFRRQATQTLPPIFDGLSLPDILLSYQQELLVSTSKYALVATDKSRRIGATWAVGADAVLTSGAEKAAGGMDTLYIGYNLDMAREFIDTCAMWARAFMPACTEVGEFLFEDTDETGKGDHKYIQAFRIRFASGFEICALSSRPRSLRGRQGYVVLDEYAFHDEPEELLKAALAFLIWGGKVLVISTHNGEDNPFNQLLKDIRAGDYGPQATVMRATFDDAITQGLYQRVCLQRGIEWTLEGEAEWRAGIRKIYRANAAEELDCVPGQGNGVYLSRALIEACATEAGPVLQLHCDEAFKLHPLGEPYRRAFVQEWLDTNVGPELAKLDKNLRHFFGQDFARSRHISAIAPLYIGRDLRRRIPFLIEMRNVPHEQQKQVLFYLVKGLPRFSGGQIDAGGNGSFLGEAAEQRFAPLIAALQLSQPWFIENMPKGEKFFDTQTVSFPRHPDVVDDLRQVKNVRGVPKVPDNCENKGSDGLPRHGDFAIAIFLALVASLMDVGEYGYEAAGKPKIRSDEDWFFDDDHDDVVSSAPLHFEGTW